MKVLAGLGLAHKLRARASAITRFDFRNARGAALGSVPLDPSAYGQPTVAMSRSLLFEALAEQLREGSRAPLRQGGGGREGARGPDLRPLR